MRNIEDRRYDVSSLRFTEGKPAKILAGVDRAVTRTTLFVQDKLGVSKDYREIEQGDFRFEVHPRYTGRHVDRIFPDGKKSSANEGDIIHVYQKGEGNEREQLIERKRVKDNPQGFSKPQR